jgi:hypothetical protein
MEFKVPDFIKRLVKSERIEEIESRLNEENIDAEKIDDKIIDHISEEISRKETEKFKKEFSKFGKSVTDRDIVDIKYLVKEVNILRLALINSTTRGKLRYIPSQMNKECIELFKPDPLETLLKSQEESEIRKFGLLD